MLRRNSSDSHLGMHSGNSASVIMKHKIRNLRAKLKTLLTSQSCTKHSKRQKCVRKLQHGQNKQFQLTCQQFNLSKQLFMYSKQSAKKYWYSPEQKCDIMNVFGKLSNEQIQQIKEDMIYYLGEDNIDKFKAFEEIKIEKEWNKENLKRTPFLKRMRTFKSEDTQRIAVSDENEKKETERRQEIARQKKQFDFQQENPVSKRQKNCSIFDKFQCFRKSFQSNNTPISNKRLNTANLIQSRASTITKRTSSKQQQKSNHKFQANYLGNRQNFLQKRHIIEQQEKAQRIITKITMQMKQQKAVDVFRMTKDAFLSTIKQKNTMNDFKTKKILEDKYKKNVTFGQIVELNQELRKIYIKKISPNSNLGSIYPQTDDRYLQPVIKRSNYDTTLSNFFSPSNYKYKY